MDIHERFEAVNDDYINFDRVEDKRSERPDLHAWLLLDELFPNPGHDMVRTGGFAMSENGSMSAPAHAVVIRQAWIVRMDVRYDYDQECSGVLRCFDTEELGQAFRDDLQEHWEEFRETWHSDDNRWGGRFYLSMSPQGFEGVEVEEWPIYSAV